MIWPGKIHHQWDSSPGSSALEADALTTRPMRWWLVEEVSVHCENGWDNKLDLQPPCCLEVFKNIQFPNQQYSPNWLVLFKCISLCVCPGAFKDIRPPNWCLSDEYKTYLQQPATDVEQQWKPEHDYYILMVSRLVSSILVNNGNDSEDFCYDCSLCFLLVSGLLSGPAVQKVYFRDRSACDSVLCCRTGMECLVGCLLA